MKYYIVADIHGFFTEFQTALEGKGYFDDTDPHKLIICGDLFDRGGEAAKLQAFVLELMEKGDVILIRGNHEDLMMDMLNKWHKKSYYSSHHESNGTIDTVCQLTGSNIIELFDNPDLIGQKLLHTPYVQQIIPSTLDYYETQHYIFVHGWIPCHAPSNPRIGGNSYKYIENWREADRDEWNEARWINGMEAAHFGVVEKGKTIVCGHWNTSFGHSRYEGRGGEWRNNPDFSPYFADGIIALDACTVRSGFVNCIVVNDDELPRKEHLSHD